MIISPRLKIVGYERIYELVRTDPRRPDEHTVIACYEYSNSDDIKRLMKDLNAAITGSPMTVEQCKNIVKQVKSDQEIKKIVNKVSSLDVDDINLVVSKLKVIASQKRMEQITEAAGAIEKILDEQYPYIDVDEVLGKVRDRLIVTI